MEVYNVASRDVQFAQLSAHKVEAMVHWSKLMDYGYHQWTNIMSPAMEESFKWSSQMVSFQTHTHTQQQQWHGIRQDFL